MDQKVPSAEVAWLRVLDSLQTTSQGWLPPRQRALGATESVLVFETLWGAVQPAPVHWVMKMSNWVSTSAAKKR